jgi:hypothetical protein
VELQGYYFSRPAPAADVVRLMHGSVRKAANAA